MLASASWSGLNLLLSEDKLLLGLSLLLLTILLLLLLASIGGGTFSGLLAGLRSGLRLDGTFFFLRYFICRCLSLDLFVAIGLSDCLPLGLLLVTLGLPLLLLLESLLFDDLALLLALLLLGLACLTLHAPSLADLQLALLSALRQLSLDLLLPALMRLLLLGLSLLPLEGGKPAVLFVNLKTAQVLIDLGLFEVEVAADLLELLGLDGGGDKVLDLLLLVLDKVVLVLSQGVLVVVAALGSGIFLLLLMMVISLSCCLLSSVLSVILLAIATSAMTALLCISMITTSVVIALASRLIATASTTSTVASSAGLIATLVLGVFGNCAKVVARVIVTIVGSLVSIGCVTWFIVGVWLLVASAAPTATRVRTAALLVAVVVRLLIRRLGISCCGCLYLLSR